MRKSYKREVAAGSLLFVATLYLLAVAVAILGNPVTAKLIMDFVSPLAMITVPSAFAVFTAHSLVKENPYVETDT